MNNNPLLENLQNRVVQQLPVKNLYADNAYAIFDRGITEFYGEKDEYISDQPLEGVEWSKDLTEADFKKLPAVFSCKLGVVKDIVVYTIYNSKKMKQATQSPAHQATLVDRLVDSMKTKAQLVINDALDDIISTKDNYRESAWIEITSDEAKIDSQDKAIAALKRIKQVYNGMDTPSQDYNKGYQKPGTSPWNKVLANCETPKSKVFIVNPDYLDDLELYFLSDVGNDSNLNPHKIFKKVITRKLKNGILWSIQDEKSVVYRIINDEGIQEEKTLGGGMTKFAWEIELIAGMISFTNSVVLTVKQD